MNQSTRRGIAIAALGLVLWLALAAMRPVSPGHLVNPGVTPPDVRPEWYFLALYALLQYVPERIGVLIPGILGVGLALLPYVAPAAGRIRRRAVQVATLLGAVAYLTLTVLGLTGGGSP